MNETKKFDFNFHHRLLRSALSQQILGRSASLISRLSLICKFEISDVHETRSGQLF